MNWIERTTGETMNSAGARNVIAVACGLARDHTVGVNKTLSIGCGDGTELSYLPGDVTGLDGNPDSIALAKSKGFKAVLADMHKTPFSDGEFDLVFSRDVFEHAESHINLMFEMARMSSKYVAIVLPDQSWGYSEVHSIVPDLRQMIYLAQKAGLSLKRLEEYNVLVGSTIIFQTFYLFIK